MRLTTKGGLFLGLSVLIVAHVVLDQGVDWFTPVVVGDFFVCVLEVLNFRFGGIADHDVLHLLDDDEVGILCRSARSVGCSSFSFGLAFSTASFGVQPFCCCFSSGSLFLCGASLFGS